MAVTKTKMDVQYLKNKVEEAKKKYIKQHALEVVAYTKDKARYDKEIAKYNADILAKCTAAFKTGSIKFISVYNNQVTFMAKGDSKIFNTNKPQMTLGDPGKFNTGPFDAKLAILQGCVETFISISVEDYDWMKVLL